MRSTFPSCLALCALLVLVHAGQSEQAGPAIQTGVEVHATIVASAERLLGSYTAVRGGGPNVLVALGNAAESRQLISEGDVNALSSSDAFVIRSGWSKSSPSVFVFACAGKSPRATNFAFYELLQNLGFGFLHPLKPILPESLPHPLPTLDMTEEPRWELRGTHYHTQHPLELTNLLNGYDSAGQTSDRGSWARLLPEWKAYLDWMLAQKQNYIEWMLLADTAVPRPWERDREADFELSAERQTRLQILVEDAHQRGIEVGIDLPMVFQQQHALSMLPAATQHWETDIVTIKARVQWLLNAGIDHMGTELGATEFNEGVSAPYAVRILSYVQSLIGNRRLLVKNHCSTSQVADGYTDPRPGHEGAPLNFNYLSYYADPRIVAMPHSVQIYSLEDPAPTYGNVGFRDLRNWTRFLLEDNRPVAFYPETSYWVNYDINVPLFLAPIYTRSRVEDANDIDGMGGARPLLGQVNFESGWQWGYWLGNSAQALVAWSRVPDAPSAFTKLFRFLGPPLQTQLTDLLNDYVKAQKSLLIDGISNNAKPPPGIGFGSVTGMSYIMGSEGLSDAGSLGARFMHKGAPQPDRLMFADLWTSRPLLGSTGMPVGSDGSKIPARLQWYHSHLRPLLANMNTTFASLSLRFAGLSDASPAAQDSLRDLAISARLLSLRCSQVLSLYDHAANCGTTPSDDRENGDQPGWCKEKLTAARMALNEALSLVPEQEAHYGLSDNNTNRVAGWRSESPNPTAYNFGYLWAVRHLFYWQRDQAIVERRIQNPCFGTLNDVVQLAQTKGGSNLVHSVRDAIHSLFSNRLWSMPLAECMAVPEEEPAPLGIFQKHSNTANPPMTTSNPEEHAIGTWVWARRLRHVTTSNPEI